MISQFPQEGFEKYHEWYKNVMQLDCVKKTLADEAQLIAKYQRYADNTAASLVADAIRKGHWTALVNEPSLCGLEWGGR